MEAPKTPSGVMVRFLDQNEQYLRESNESDRVFTKGKKVEVVFALVSKGIPLFRTEGVGDVTLIDLRVRNTSVSVPAILPEKIQAKLRRQMLEILRGGFSNRTKDHVKKYKDELAFKKLGDDGSWNCYVAPPKEAGEADIGMCGFCPACNILGTVITNAELDAASTSYGIKSRVVHEIAYGTVKYEKAVEDLTHTKVGDGVSYTGRALFEESHVVPGVVFIGKLAMYDVTKKEAKLILSTLSSITRMGGGETKYGALQVIILGLKAGSRETISSYDIARYVLEKYGGDLVDPEDVIKTAVEYVRNKEFTVIVNPNAKLDDMDTHVELSKEELDIIWSSDNYQYSRNVVEYINRAEGRVDKVREKERKKGKSGSGMSN